MSKKNNSNSHIPSIYFIFMSTILLLASIACEKAVIPVTGSYTGVSESIVFGFENILDSNGNMLGIREVRDTTMSQGDVISLKQVDNESLFTIEGQGGLMRLNGLSDHEFEYSEQSAFSVVSSVNGVETKRLEFSIDASGNMDLLYLENESPDPNAPPAGREIRFTGVKN